MTYSRHLRLALAGQLVGEALDRRDRHRLVSIFHGRGWTDRQVAAHTRWTDHTVLRLRERMGLPPNRSANGKGTG